MLLETLTTISYEICNQSSFTPWALETEPPSLSGCKQKCSFKQSSNTLESDLHILEEMKKNLFPMWLVEIFIDLLFRLTEISTISNA